MGKERHPHPGAEVGLPRSQTGLRTQSCPRGNTSVAEGAEGARAQTWAKNGNTYGTPNLGKEQGSQWKGRAVPGDTEEGHAEKPGREKSPQITFPSLCGLSNTESKGSSQGMRSFPRTQKKFTPE